MSGTEARARPSAVREFESGWESWEGWGKEVIRRFGLWEGGWRTDTERGSG
jgi:hypothetical protein